MLKSYDTMYDFCDDLAVDFQDTHILWTYGDDADYIRWVRYLNMQVMCDAYDDVLARYNVSMKKQTFNGEFVFNNGFHYTIEITWCDEFWTFCGTRVDRNVLKTLITAVKSEGNKP